MNAVCEIYSPKQMEQSQGKQAGDIWFSAEVCCIRRIKKAASLQPLYILLTRFEVWLLLLLFDRIHFFISLMQYLINTPRLASHGYMTY